MTVPRFSVVIPAYNVAELLPRAVESVRSQSLDDWELIIVDDGSTDGQTPELADQIAGGDPGRIRAVHRPNGGLPAARNTGVEHANGELVIFLDADDELTPECLDLHARAFEQSSAGWALCDVLRVEGENRRVLRSDLDPAHPLQSAMLRRFAPMRAIGFRREFLGRFGSWDNACRIFEDVDYYARLLIAGEPYAYVDTPVYRYHIQTESITRTAKRLRNLRAIEAFYRRYYPAHCGDPAIRAEYAVIHRELAGHYRHNEGSAWDIARTLLTHWRWKLPLP